MPAYSSTIIMNRKRKTQKHLNIRLPITTPRPSLKYSHLLTTEHTYHETAIRDLVQELVARAERAICLREQGSEKIREWLETIETEQERYIEISQPHLTAPIFCEPQPKTASSHLPPFSPAPAPAPAPQNKLNTPESLKTNRDQHQATIQQQQSRTRQAHIRRWEEIRRCQRNEFISLKKQHRNSQGQDRSEQIQELLRRKKQLFQQNKCPPRVQTEVSRTFSTDLRGEKEKRQFWQNDDGQACQIIHKPIKVAKEMVPVLNLSHIRVVPGQQSTTLLKKKPIVDLVTVRRRKRKGVGDTCVFIEQLREIQTSGQDLSEIIQQTYRPQKDTKLVLKQRRMTTIVRLPTLR